MSTEDRELIGVSEAARMLRLSEDAVRRLEDRGLLKARRTSWGMRIFERVDVEKLVAARSVAK